ncbi:MAG: hypothetical protein HFF96_09970 [Oscillibacter sp.]|uniref:hypothetical protein n=1 Tax=Oscillibacter sp. TaxID=1945593 RepID=UPI0021705B58|nr:hypothetical protein [Oscillibacter sp.]MCI9114566.1 hypothetical protein [Oscillibacter sp.]
MAMKPLRPCLHPGCGVLVSSGYCAAHQPRSKDQRGAEAQAWRWMYGTDVWKRLREDQLLREPFCRECARRGVRRYATDVDHIRDHKEDNDLRIDKLTDEEVLQLGKRLQAVMGKQPVSPALAPELQEAKAKGITDGTSPGAFCTRAQAAVMTLRAAKKA